MLQDRFVHVRRAENQLQHFYRCFAQINRKSSDESCDCALLSSNFQCPFTRIIDNRAMNFVFLSHFFFFSHWIEHISPFLNIFETCIGNFYQSWMSLMWIEFFSSSDFPFIKEVWCFLTIGKFYLCLLHSLSISLPIHLAVCLSTFWIRHILNAEDPSCYTRNAYAFLKFVITEPGHITLF